MAGLTLICLFFYHIYSSGLSLPSFSEKVKERLIVQQPNLYKLVYPFLETLSFYKRESSYFREVNVQEWSGVGADWSFIRSSDASYSIDKNKIQVTTTSELIQAIQKAQAGDVIVISPGEYHINSNKLTVGQRGAADHPIHLTAKQLGTVKIYLKGEGIVVNKPFWQFSNLYFIGDCQIHSKCEHALHIVGKGSNTLITNNILQNFNAMIKVNGVGDDYPDFGQISHNTFFNSDARSTNNPVTPIDIMHANHWKVIDNFIFDIQKSEGNKVSYAAFFKGGSGSGLFERNLVICAANLPSTYTALGLSLGGGGSLKKHRRAGREYEHIGGVIRNNIIMHCGKDVGIYLNRAKNSIIEHNILYNTLGIDIRFSESNAIIRNNIISGRIKERDKAKIMQENNFVRKRNFLTNKDDLTDFFVAPDIGNFSLRKKLPISLSESKLLSTVDSDFCGIKVNRVYIGASSESIFCTDKVNIKKQY